jgi:hypothetical protein
MESMFVGSFIAKSCENEPVSLVIHPSARNNLRTTKQIVMKFCIGEFY